MELLHGGDIYSYAETHGGALPLDFSANINPFGTPPAVQDAMHAALARCDRYPDPLCRALRRAIGRSEGVDPEAIFCGNGAAEVLFRLSAVLKPRCALLLAPTFAEYEQSLAGCELRFHTLHAEDDFAVTERILQDITPNIDAVYLCNPNNPTGHTIPPALLREIARRCAAADSWLMVDECFLDFLPDADAHTLKGLLATYPKLVLLRAFTKMFAVPGVRLGYCMAGSRELTRELRRAGQPWNVSVIAEACGIAATQEGDFVRETARKIATEREFLAQELRAMGFAVTRGEANFLLFRADDVHLHQKLAARGVLVRSCANYRALAAGYYRTAVRTRAEHMALLAALRAVAASGE